MTHLQQLLEARRALRGGAEDYAVDASGPVSALTLQQAAGEAWSFLWSTLVSAWYDSAEGREKIVLTFLHHVVCVEGQNLDRIMGAVGEMRLHAVREHDGSSDYKERSQTGHTVVAKITVERVDEVPLTVESLNHPET